MQETPHILEQDLDAFARGLLPAKVMQAAAEHLDLCAECREAVDEVRLGIRSVELLPVVEAPESIWKSIEANLTAVVPIEPRRQQRRQTSWMRFAQIAAALAMVLLGGLLFWRMWEQRQGWIETGASENRNVVMDRIGVVELQPETRLRVAVATPGQRRLTMAYGQIHVKVIAPPRLFQVETSAGTAVDLGCEYDLACDRHGNGFLRVTQGWVSYEWQGRESIAPAGSSCRTRAGKQPGMPVFDDAPEAFREAVSKFEENAGSVDAVLAAATSGPRDTLTLWHLLPRASSTADRIRIYERMAALAPPPPAATRDAILALDAAALRAWREELAWNW